MDPSISKSSSLALSPYSSPNVAALLKIKINAWSKESGLPASVRVRVGGKVFALHKHPLVSRSGYFKKVLSDTTDILLPHDFPGGAEAFEMVALFSYGASTLIDPFNVASLRCAAEFLEMTEAYSPANLCERSDLYFIQVVLQNWDDTLIVLQKCQTLLPMSEQLLIVSRCVESLAFMTCMEILDPDRRRDRPTVTLESLNNHAWSSEMVKELACQDLWINLISLPLRFFKRIIASLRRQGMKEKYVCPIIIFYGNKWLLSSAADGEASIILQGILDLLPMADKASRVIPVGFYLALLSRGLHLGLNSNHIETMARLQHQIATLLHLAAVDDLLFPENDQELISSSVELTTMESIFSASVLSNAAKGHAASDVAELWDRYLSYVATDPKMCPDRFMDLIGKIPISHRKTHDHLYRAINTFLLVHPHMSQEDKASVCKYLSCQKLSQEMCIEAVQNDLMPLRLIVQALFVQQLHTHQAFKDCSDSFRYAHCGDFSGSLSSSRCPNTKTHILGETPPYEQEEAVVRPLGFLLQKDPTMHSSELSRKDYESTSFRIQNLEKELMSLKRSLNIPAGSEPPATARQSGLKTYGLEKRSMSRKRNPTGQVTGCIGSLSFASQRKYANRLLKIFRRISLFGISKSKKKSGKPIGIVNAL